MAQVMAALFLSSFRADKVCNLAVITVGPLCCEQTGEHHFRSAQMSEDQDVNFSEKLSLCNQTWSYGTSECCRRTWVVMVN